MPHVELPAGTIDYDDTGGHGPVVVLVHGLLMDGAQWRHVVADLRRDHRCVLPTLPMGAHRRPMPPDADLSLRGLGRIVTEFIERLDLRDVTLCFNDWCGAQVMIADGGVERVGRLALVSCEAFENYPPGLPGRLAGLAARVPGGVAVARRALLSRRLRQLPMFFGHMSKRGIPDDIMREWLQPLTRPEIRRDYRKYAGDTRRGKRDLLAATGALPAFDRPVLIAWATEDRLMPPDHARRLARAFSNSQLAEIPDSYTLIPEDQPAVLAARLRRFIAACQPPATPHQDRSYSPLAPSLCHAAPGAAVERISWRRQMKISNCHERIVAATPERVAAIVADFDGIWPTQIAPAPRGQGRRLYDTGPMVWEEFDRPGAARAFRVISPEWLQCEHWFELERVDGGTLLRHRLEGQARGKYGAVWSERIEPFHNRVLEAVLDNVEAAVASEA